MRIANHTEALEARFGALAAVRMNLEAGFEAIDYSMYNADGAVFSAGGKILARELRRLAASYGAVFNQAHAPFTHFKIGAENNDENRAIYYSVLKSIDIAAELGAGVIVVHPAVICPHLSADDRYEMNMEFYSAVLPRAKNLGVKIAIENLWARHKDNPDRIVKSVCSDAAELIRYVDGMDDPYVTACLDIGHAGLVGESADLMIRSLGSRLGALHINDNDFSRDRHLMPYAGNVNFTGVIRALGSVGYDGDITLESNYYLDTFPDALVPAGLQFMARTAAYIRDEVAKSR